MEIIRYNYVLNIQIVENLKHYKIVLVHQKNTDIDIQILVMNAIKNANVNITIRV